MSTVVAVRSYSPMTGQTSLDRLTKISRSPASSRTISPIRCSCVGLRNDHSRHTASAVMSGVEQLADGPGDGLLVELEQDMTGLVDPLGHLAHEAARHDRLGVAATAVPAEPLGRDARGEAHAAAG